MTSVSHTSYSETSILNGSSDLENGTLNSSSEKSFIQQRVERLYGPGALAQGFFFKRSSASRLDSSDLSNKSTNNNNTSLDDTNAEESLKNLPVLRHLRPEFRAQLPVVSPRRPTDGTEQMIKPLKRSVSFLLLSLSRIILELKALFVGFCENDDQERRVPVSS